MDTNQILKELSKIKYELAYIAETFGYDSYLSFEVPEKVSKIIKRHASTISSQSASIDALRMTLTDQFLSNKPLGENT